MTPTETVRAVAAELPGGGECAPAVRAVMRMVVNQIAAGRGLTPPWTVDLPNDVRARVDKHIDDLDHLEAWGALELGTTFELLMNPDERKASGAYYTPPEVADAMVRLAIGPQLDRLAQDPDPGNLLQVLAIDPCCGAGVFLISACRFIAARYAAAIAARAGLHPLPDGAVRMVMPEVLTECVFGVDRDPTAVDLTKSVLWLEIHGTEPITFMDRNVICGNSLNDEMPPAFEERRRAA